MSYPIQCTCGNVKGTLHQTKSVNRCVCYCTDCQAFARFLKRDNEILDKSGGTDIIQTPPKNVAFSEGTEYLACMRLSAKGLLRWYTTCCNTPIGNTLPNFKASFIGLVHNCLNAGQTSLNQAFGPVRMHVHTKRARGEPKPKQEGLPAGFLRIAGMLLKARLDGSYKFTPFFNPQTGVPIVTPKVLSREEREELKSVE